jgi:prephenate dehydrogenase
VTIIGIGLIGGSLALDLRQAGLAERVVGVSRSAENRRLAIERGLATEATADLAAALRTADLAVLAVPVTAIVGLLPEIARHVPDGCLVTDVGSVKRPILAAGDAAFPDGRFVAGHPIAGSEHSGPAAARTGLFAQHTWIATPSPRTGADAEARIAALWRTVGATTLRMSAEWHDEVFATVSHLPHLVAYALMDAVMTLEQGGERVKFSAGGLRDFTRIAGSDPVMWRDIFLMNREPILRAVGAYRAALDRLEAAIRTGDGEALSRGFAQARVAREELGHRS